MVRRFFIYSERKCLNNDFEIKKLRGFLLSKGWLEETDIKRASAAFVFGCCFRQRLEDRFNEYLEQVVKPKIPLDCKVFICGCIGNYHKDLYTSMGYRVLDNLDEIGESFSELQCTFTEIEMTEEDVNLSFKKIQVPSILDYDWAKLTYFEKEEIKRNLYKYYYYTYCKLFEDFDFYFQWNSVVNVATGCLSTCTYCTHRKSRGKLRSVPLEVIGSCIKRLAAAYKHILILSDDLGAYGLDISKNIVELLRLFNSIHGSHKYLLAQFNPKYLIAFREEISELLNERYLSLHVPIESGSDKILRTMNRGYTIDEVEESLMKIKEKNKKIKILVNLIVGFPGEEWDDIMKTRALVRRWDIFDFIQVYKFQARPGTVAASMAEQLTEDEKIKRSEMLFKEHLERKTLFQNTSLRSACTETI